MKISETVKYGCYLWVNRSLRVLRGYCYTSRGVILYYIITEIYILVQVDRVACRCYSITLYLNVVTSLEVVTLHSLYPCATYLCTKGTSGHKDTLCSIHLNVLTTLEIDVALTRYYIDITFVNLYVYISVVTYFYSVVVVICTSVCVDKDSHTTVYCGATVAFDVGEVITCYEVIVVLLDPCDLTAIRVYLIAGA